MLVLVALSAAGPSPAATPPTLPLRWSTIDAMPLPVFDAAASLSDGWIVVTGGFGSDLATTPAIQVYRDARGWRPIGTQLAEPRARHTQTTLPDGRILVVGGVQGSLKPDASSQPVPLASAEVLHPLMAGSDVIQLGEPLLGHTATLLADGRVAVVGGEWVRLFDPQREGFMEAIRLQHRRSGHAAVLWNRIDYPAAPQNDEPKVATVEQELSIERVPTARGASVGATMEPQKVVVPEAREQPIYPTRLVLLIIGGDVEGTIEEVDIAKARSRLWEAKLPLPIDDACAAATRDGRVLFVGGVARDTGVTIGAAWWLDSHETITAGPDLDLLDGCASAACFVDTNDGSVIVLGGEERDGQSIHPAPAGRMIRGGGQRIFALPLSRSSAPFVRRVWLRLDDRQVAAIGGYRFVQPGDATGNLSAGVNVRGIVDVVRLPSPVGGD